MDPQTAEALKAKDSEQIVELIGELELTSTVSDGGEAGPFPCSGLKSGLEYFVVRWIVDLQVGSYEGVLADFDSRLLSQGYSADRTWINEERPKVIYHGFGREVSLTHYADTELALLELTTECGAKSVSS